MRDVNDGVADAGDNCPTVANADQTDSDNDALGNACDLCPTDNTNDIDGLAALITACDLVVTVSNSTAHLAGALGTPTLLLLPQSRGRLWYWFNDRNDSPWYPSMRIERQKVGQSWKELIVGASDQVAALLRQARAGQTG